MLSQKELLILANLRTNSRESLTRMSRKTSIPVSTIYDKIKKYENKLIRKNTCLIDFQQLGFKTRATVMLKVRKQQKDELKQTLMKHKAVNNFYKITNGFDYFVEAIFKDIHDVESFLEGLEEKFDIEEKQIHYIIEDLRKEDFLSNPDYIKLIGAKQ